MSPMISQATRPSSDPPEPEIPRESLIGFRFSWTDALVLVAAAGLTFWLAPILGSTVWLLPWVVGHYFLFCNVIRLRQRYELIWAVSFVLLTATSALAAGLGPWSWLNAGGSAVLTLVLVILEVRSERYHGIFAERWNERIDDYVRIRREELTRSES